MPETSIADRPRDRVGGAEPAPSGSPARSYHLEVFLISLAGLLLELAYTRIVSFKLFYYYTYFVIGLALLGIGSGAVVVALSRRARAAATATVLYVSLLVGALTIGIGYLVVARLPINTVAIWQYSHTRSAVWNLFLLLLICLTIFASFVPIGVMTATLFGRRSEKIGRLYFADLLGAGVACAVAVPLLDNISAPSMVMLAGLVLALAGLRLALTRPRRPLVGTGAGIIAALLLLPIIVQAVAPRHMVDVRDDATKDPVSVSTSATSKWNSIFRIDATPYPSKDPTRMILFHDGLIGSAIYKYDPARDLHCSNTKTVPTCLTRYDTDPRALPFALLGNKPVRDLIIGAAGGNEILASIHFNASKIDAVELNPVTYGLVTGKYADFDGHLADQPHVNYVLGDGRSYLDHSKAHYDLVWYPAPDSYAATNTGTAGAFVLSESYLYTEEAIKSSLDHLAPGGILATQFGEVNYALKPNRTARYVSTARAALKSRGIDDPSRHIIVLTSPTTLGASTVSTILVKNTPFTQAEISRVLHKLTAIPGGKMDYVPGRKTPLSLVNSLITVPDSQLAHVYNSYRFDVRPVTDDKPYFWHFSDFSFVVKNFTHQLNPADPENETGERVLLLLLAISVVFAAIFLLLPFALIRQKWRKLPRKGLSAVYFCALGLGFMLFEVSLIQRFTLFLGYPTYSLTVTLASLLTFTGIGAWISNRFLERPRVALPIVSGGLVALTLAYLFGLPPLTSALFDAAFPVRVLITAVMLAPLGLCLGCFMPFGLRAVARLTDEEDEYVAWGWAVSGFASVVGSVLTTILAMTFGLGTVLVLAIFVYAVAVGALVALSSRGRAAAS